MASGAARPSLNFFLAIRALQQKLGTKALPTYVLFLFSVNRVLHLLFFRSGSGEVNFSRRIFGLVGCFFAESVFSVFLEGNAARFFSGCFLELTSRQII